MIRVVNRHNYNGKGIYVGRPSVLGNPWSHRPETPIEYRTSTRREAIDNFEDYLDNLAEESEAIIKILELVSLYKQQGELVLICSCAPQDCHAYVIAKKIRKIIDNEQNNKVK